MVGRVEVLAIPAGGVEDVGADAAGAGGRGETFCVESGGRVSIRDLFGGGK